MKAINYLLAFVISFSLSASAQKKNANNSLLWEVSGNGLKKQSYIFGTYHFADKGFIDTMKVLNDKLKGADAIVGEIVIDKDLATKLMPYMVMKDNTLDKIFSPEEYKLVADYLKKFPGYDLKLFNAMKPIVLQTIIVQLTAPKTFTAENPAIDGYFQTYGVANNKKILGLETAEDQAKVLFGSSIERQKELLLKFIKEDEKNQKDSKDLYQYYIMQDLGKLETMFNDRTYYTAAEMDLLLKDRNVKWIAQLPELMKGQSLFIAVGAGHLVGKDGLIKGLQAKGYTVKPVATN